MPRSSRSKSHKQSKRSSREVKEYSDSEEDVKVKERNNGEEDGSFRVSKVSVNLASGEKRKVASQSRDGKDLSGYGNADAADEHVASKRRKERAEGGGSDRWNADGDERIDVLIIDKDSKGENLKSKEVKVSVDSRSRSSRRHDSVSEKKEDGFSLGVDKEESKVGRVDSKRKSEKDSGRKESREIKEKERGGTDKERSVQDTTGGEVARKHGSHSVHISEERHGKRGRENTERPIQDELRNRELEKELEKRIRRRGDGSSDKHKFQDDVRDSDDKMSSRGDRSKDVRHKDERHGDKYEEDGEKYNRHMEGRYREDAGKDSRRRYAKYREDGDRNRHRDDKYHEDNDRKNIHREDKYREDGDRDDRHKDDKYRENGDRGNRHKDVKYREDGDRNNRCREDKYREDVDKDDRHRDDKYREDPDKENRHKEEKHWDDVDRDSRHRDAKQRNNSDRDNRTQDVKCRDEYSSRDRTSESEMQRSRDESNAADLQYRKSSNCDISPIYDDPRYKDDKGSRRANDTEDYTDVWSRSTKEQSFDVDKRSVSGKADLVTDRGRSNLWNVDVDITLNNSRRRSSPSSNTHAGRDHYRVSKFEESKYRDCDYEERIQNSVSSSIEFAGAGLNEKLGSSRSMEKSIHKDDIRFSELSSESRPRSDAPLRMVDKSPSSTSTERRHLNRSDVRRSLDVEESGQRSGGSRDYSGREGKQSRELPMEIHKVDELFQADGDNSSVSSPFTRNNNFSGNSRSILPPPPPLRAGVDSPKVFGPSEDGNRGRLNNRQRRIGDSNMGRSQGNAWKGVPNWPSPVPNGFMPFQHGPPPVGFSVIQQFPAPPMYSVRPAMDLNHNLPYHMPDADRFSGHGRPFGWQNPVDDSCPPPLHGWDANSAGFSDDARVYGRSDWDQNRAQMSGRGWDTSGDMWKGNKLSADLTAAPQKEDLARPVADEDTQTELDQPNLSADSSDLQSSDALDDITSEAPNNTPEESHKISKISLKDDAFLYNVYLSKLDISTDLTRPELYDQFTSLIDLDQNTLADEDDFNILYVEEILEAKVADKISNDAIFAAINDSVFQKAMSLYEKQREEIGAINREKVSSPNLESLKVVQTYDNEKSALNDENKGGLASCCDGQEAEQSEDVGMSRGFDACPATSCQKLDEPCVTGILVISKEEVCTPKVMEMEVDPVPKQEVADISVDDKFSTLRNGEQSDAFLPGKFEEMKRFSSPGCSPANNEKKFIETKCVPLLFSDVSAEACEAVMPGSIESGSVNLSRIHHSPESTH